MSRAFIILVWGLLCAPTLASAHAFLERAHPPAGAEIHDPPATVSLTFSEPVEPRYTSIEVQDATGKRIDTGEKSASGGGKTVSLGLPRLPPGRYRVLWHATSVDTHKTEGHYIFEVLP